MLKRFVTVLLLTAPLILSSCSYAQNKNMPDSGSVETTSVSVSPEKETDKVPASSYESSGKTELTPQEACKLLFDDIYKGSELYDGAVFIDNDDFMGYDVVTRDNGTQIYTWKIKFKEVSENNKCYIFWLHEFIIDNKETGDGHNATGNYFAVDKETGEIYPRFIDYDWSKKNEEYDEATEG